MRVKSEVLKSWKWNEIWVSLGERRTAVVYVWIRVQGSTSFIRFFFLFFFLPPSLVFLRRCTAALTSVEYIQRALAHTPWFRGKLQVKRWRWGTKEMLCVCVCSQRLYHVKKERDSDQSHNNIQHMLSPMKTGNENRTDWERHRFLTTLGHKAVLYGLM